MRADSSVPFQQIQVINAIQATPIANTAHLLAAAPSRPKSRNVYCPATKARLGITSTSATITPQPPNQPFFGPSARVTQANVVPQSGSARFM